MRRASPSFTSCVRNGNAQSERRDLFVVISDRSQSADFVEDARRIRTASTAPSFPERIELLDWRWGRSPREAYSSTGRK